MARGCGARETLTWKGSLHTVEVPSRAIRSAAFVVHALLTHIRFHAQTLPLPLRSAPAAQLAGPVLRCAQGRARHTCSCTDGVEMHTVDRTLGAYDTCVQAQAGTWQCASAGLDLGGICAH